MILPSVLAWDDGVALGLLDAAVTFFGAAFFTTFALALTGVLFLAAAVGLDDFLGTEDGLVALGFLTLLWQKRMLSFGGHDREFSQNIISRKVGKHFGTPRGYFTPWFQMHKLRNPPPTSGTTNPRGMLGRYTNIFSGG